MYKTPEEIIAYFQQKDRQDRGELESAIGDFCDALTGFVEIAGEWKTAADGAFNLNFADAKDNFFRARAVALSVLTARTLSVARDVPRVLQSGAMVPTVVTWRYIAEAKNIALLIDLNVDGTAGFLWLHHKAIEQAKADPTSKEAKSVADLAERVLAEAGFPYDSRARDPWARGIDGGVHTNAIDRSTYIWKYRNFPPSVPEEWRAHLRDAEQKMIRVSNAFAHPSLAPWDLLRDKSHAMMISTVIEVMAVILAYKAAASDAAGWPYTETVGEQFHIYPQENQEAGILSLMVKETHEHCMEVFKTQFGLE